MVSELSSEHILPFALRIGLGANEKREIELTSTGDHRLMFVPKLEWKEDANGILPFFGSEQLLCHVLDWSEGEHARIVIENKGVHRESVEVDLIVTHFSAQYGDRQSNSLSDYAKISNDTDSVISSVKVPCESFHDFFSRSENHFNLLSKPSKQILITHPKTYLTIQALNHHLSSPGTNMPNVVQYFGPDSGENMLAVYKFLTLELPSEFYFNVIWMKSWDSKFANRIKETFELIGQTRENKAKIDFFEESSMDVDSYPFRADLMIFTYVAPWMNDNTPQFRDHAQTLFKIHSKPNTVLLSVDPKPITDEKTKILKFKLARSANVPLVLTDYWGEVSFLKRLNFAPYQHNASSSQASLFAIRNRPDELIKNFEVSKKSFILADEFRSLIPADKEPLRFSIKAFDDEQPMYQRKNINGLIRETWQVINLFSPVWIVDALTLVKADISSFDDLVHVLSSQTQPSNTFGKLNRITKHWFHTVAEKIDFQEYLLDSMRGFSLVLMHPHELSTKLRHHLDALLSTYQNLRLIKYEEEWNMGDMSDADKKISLANEQYNNVKIDSVITLAFVNWLAQTMHLRFVHDTLNLKIADELNSRNDHDFKVIKRNNEFSIHCFSKKYAIALMKKILSKSSQDLIILSSGQSTTKIPRDQLELVMDSLDDEGVESKRKS